jgi:hypothetical protein
LVNSLHWSLKDRPIWRRPFFDIQGDDPKRPTSFKRVAAIGRRRKRSAGVHGESSFFGKKNMSNGHLFGAKPGKKKHFQTPKKIVESGKNPKLSVPGFAIPALRSFTIRQVEIEKTIC